MKQNAVNDIGGFSRVYAFRSLFSGCHFGYKFDLPCNAYTNLFETIGVFACANSVMIWAAITDLIN